MLSYSSLKFDSLSCFLNLSETLQLLAFAQTGKTEQSVGAYWPVLLSARSLGDSTCFCSRVQMHGWVDDFAVVWLILEVALAADDEAQGPLHDRSAGWRSSRCGLAVLQAGYRKGVWKPALGPDFEHRNPLDSVWEKSQK